ncbi:MAG TPA: adenylate/guanylate cyclase domain-containing protein, partial [Spirochaetota bacterium]|nr:adenylate/guanylate cyclase domain-containing protein [Spirochaetota bacterium]
MIKKEKIERYFPEGALDKIAGFGENPLNLAEKRYAVIMFVDISGYTAISEKLAPEKVAEIINSCFSILIDITCKYGGYVDKFIGDCILTVFGINNNDNPEIAACLCSIEMQERIVFLNSQLKKDYDFDFAISAGIHCGNLILGNIGSEVRMDYTVIGDAVNTASRIQNTAKSGETLISSEIYDKVKNFINAEPLTPVIVKNKSLPLSLFKIISKKETKLTKFRSIPLIGREKELKILKEIINDDLKEKIFIIEGEHGSGKSRIIEEITDFLNQKEVVVFNYSGDIYTRNFILNPFREIFLNFSNFIHFDQFKNLKKEFDNFKIQNGYLESFFEEKEGQKKSQINRDALFDTFRIYLKNLSSFRKLVFIFEDIQYLDAGSVELIKYLMKTLNKADVYFVLSKRDDFTFDIQTAEFTLLKIENLSKVETEIFVDEYLESPIEKALSSFLYEKSSGNPFFLIEIIDRLKNLDLFVKNEDITRLKTKDIGALPDSINALILSKIDKLDYEERKILNSAALLGYVIEYESLKKICELKDFEERVEKLINLGYFNLTLEKNIKNLFFKNQITLLALDESIIERNKKDIHLKIAEVLEKEEDKRLEKIAYHFESAKKEYKAIYYYFLSGIRSRNSYDFDSALIYLNKALYYAEKNQNPSEKSQTYYDEEITLKDFGRIRIFFKYDIKVKLTIEVIYYILGQTLFYNDNNYRIFFEKALEYSEKSGNNLIYFLSKITLFDFYIFYNEEKYLYSYLESLEKKAKSLKDDFLLGYYYAQYITFLIEKYDRRKIDEKKYKKIAENFHNSKKIVDNSTLDLSKKNNFYIFWYWNCGMYYKTLEKSSKTLVGVFNLGERYIIGDYEKMSYYERLAMGGGGLDDTPEQSVYLEKALELAKKTNSFLKTAHFYSTLAYLSLKKSDYEKSMDYNLNSLKICEEIDNKFELGMIHKNLGDLYLNLSNYDEALSSYEKSVEYKENVIACKTLVDFANIIFPLSALVFLYIKKDRLKDAENS